jgi:hypothetical protein
LEVKRKKHGLGDPFDTYRFIKLPAQVRVPGDGKTIGIWLTNIPSNFDRIGGEAQLERELNGEAAGVNKAQGRQTLSF